MFVANDVLSLPRAKIGHCVGNINKILCICKILVAIRKDSTLFEGAVFLLYTERGIPESKIFAPSNMF